LDSSNPKALEKALRIYNGKPVINSVNAKEESMNVILPLARHYGAAVVGLCLDEDGIPETAEKRIELAERMEKRAAGLGIAREDLWIDALCLTVSAQQNQAVETLKALRFIHQDMGLPCVLGVSNISFGLPLRNQITQTFLCLAMEEGLRFPIINVNLPEMMASIRSFQVLHGYDSQSRDYIELYAPAALALKESARASAAGRQQPAGQNSLSEGSLTDFIIKGLDRQAAAAARSLLDARKAEPLEIVENYLIPALDETGKKFESGSMYLPQLLSAANASQAVFEVLKDEMAKTGSQKLDKGTIVLATVRGDVHDIGKNIVKTVLENYGFTIIDLGKDVPASVIAETVVQNSIRMVGLSALMTTTLPAMEETVRLLKQLDNPPKVMVGGAVVTRGYAKSIQADYYAKDASESAAIAREVFEG
ncbi:MAG: cobalamin-dependent protein, partial [Erysipelotrichaceae bacterium]|nr:cobalamin-dependent protein [Erysipelotrichaceae bacterium]